MSSKMPPTTSRDIESEPPRKVRERDQKDAVVRDADESEQAERDKVHGDGEKIGLENK